MRIRWLLIWIALATSPLALFGQEKERPSKFLVRVNGETVRTEEYTITRTAKEYKLKSKSLWPEINQVLEQEQVLEPDFTLKRYTLYATDPRGIQVIEAKREKDAIRMTVRLPEKEPQTGTVPLAGRVLVLDNMVVSHFQVLLDSFGGKAPALNWSFLIPQHLALVPGGVTQLPREEQGTLNGQSMAVRKYSVNAG